MFLVVAWQARTLIRLATLITESEHPNVDSIGCLLAATRERSRLEIPASVEGAVGGTLVAHCSLI